MMKDMLGDSSLDMSNVRMNRILDSATHSLRELHFYFMSNSAQFNVSI